MDIKERTFQLFQTLSGLDRISEKDTLQGDLALDSLGMVTMLLALEEEFSITFHESDMNPFELKTVEDVIALIKKYREDDYEAS